MVRHAWPEAVGSGGIVGVVAFFALSGYLITGLLMNDLRRSGRVRYGRFLRNRAVRLFPPLLAMLAALAAAMILRNPHGDQGPVWRAVVTGITYTGNLPFDHGTTAIGHLWTLATEEQFYLVWPLLLTLAFRRKRMGPMVAASAVVVLLALLLTMRAAVPDISTIYPLPTSWALALIIGAAARLWEPRLRTLLPTAARTRTVLGVAIAITLVALSFVPEDKGAAWPYLVMGRSSPSWRRGSSSSGADGADCRRERSSRSTRWARSRTPRTSGTTPSSPRSANALCRGSPPWARSP